MPPGGMDYQKWHSKWADVPDPLEEEAATGNAPPDPNAQSESVLNAVYARELGQERPVDKLRELKIKMAVEAYEKKRPTDEIMHHYWIKEAGDPEALGEYFPTGDMRNDVPVYRNRNGLVLSREKQPLGPDSDEECFGWVIGNIAERRPLYGARSEGLSAPTLSWTSFTAPEPLPILRYYTEVSAARVFKEKGNRAFQRREWSEAEDWYSQSLACKMDRSDYGEAVAMLLSNRSEVRLRLGLFDGAAEDAASAAKLLKASDTFAEPIQLLRQKTAIRLAKAQQGLKRFDDALRMLQEQRRLFPRSAEIERMLEEVQLALKAERRLPLAAAAPKRAGGASEEMLSYLSKTLESVQVQVQALGAGISDCALPQELSVSIKKVEYVLTKAALVEGGCLSDLQALFRTCGGMHSFLQITQAQWKVNLEGKLVDTFKLPTMAGVAAVVSLACEDSLENLRLAAAQAPAFFCVLGGCNRKVDGVTCERLVALVAHLWQRCRPSVAELVQLHSVVVEKAAAFLAKVAMAEPNDEAGGPDAPLLSAVCKERAVSLTFDLIACGGRVEKRALRGVVPQLAGFEGDGLLTSALPAARSLGALAARRAIAEPALLSAGDVRHLLAGVELLLLSGPYEEGASSGGAVSSVSFADYGPAAAMRFASMEAWAGGEDGEHAALMLQAIAKALEFRLLLKNRELERDNFEEAFHAGRGLFILVPLVQAPVLLAEPALLCLASLAQASPETAGHIAALGGLRAILGLPSPEAEPTHSSAEATLRSSAAARRHVAKLLSRCVDTQSAVDIFQNAGESAVKELVKLATQVHRDGRETLESFHDVVHVFFVLAQFAPGPLCRFMSEDMMHPLVELSSAPQRTEVTERAAIVVEALMKDRACRKVLKPILQRREEGKSGGYDAAEDDLLKLRAGPGPLLAAR